MENNEEQQATMDFEAIHERQNEELTELLDRRDMKRLQQRLEDMQEFDVAEFLSEIGDNRMPWYSDSCRRRRRRRFSQILTLLSRSR